MRISGKLRTLAASTAAAGLLMVGVSTASATVGSELDPAHEERLREQLDSVGVDAAGQESVIDKIEAGETLDYATGVDPVRTDTSTLTEDGITYEVVVEHFADGSFSRVKLEQPAAEGAPGQMTPQGIVGCRNTTSGSYQIRTQCKVEWDNPILGLYFYADYRFIPGAHGGGTIDRVYSYNYWGVGGTATGGSLTIPVKTGNPAIATATVIYKSVGSVTGGQQAVSLLVNGSGGSLLV